MDILDEIYELYKLHNAYERIEDGNSNELICLNHLLYERKWNLKSFDEKQNIRQHLKMKLTKIAGSQEEYEERFELENAIISIHSLIDIIESKINTLGGFDDSMTIRFRSMLFVEKYLINEYKNPKTIRTSNYNLLINLIKEILITMWSTRMI
ncbi:hypothetical protein QWZ06_15655 [Chryseobacterium tructae]|uniref:DUF4254 domain-containing protein n=1 Tax=Chryseobacterium tructae TaxID=1037380 RepID=A0ABV7XZI7_9FLAO|nr:hypothetical protein [Chryseobacterium tructae]MDN3693621.1 hypothetical protein [Chryseobacterium tructae]